MSPNQPIEQYAISTFSSNQKEKYHQFSSYNLLSYAGNTFGALSVLVYPRISFASIFYICAILSFASGIPYFLVKFPHQNMPAKNKIVLDRKDRTLRNQLGTLFAVDAFGGGLVSTTPASLRRCSFRSYPFLLFCSLYEMPFSSMICRQHTLSLDV